MTREPEIYCPGCAFRPRAADRWVCLPGCGISWNTFWTHGVCPGCGHTWQYTQCLECLRRSAHEAWYHYPDGAEPQQQESVRDTVLED